MKDAPTEEIRLKFALKEGKVGIAGVADAIQNVADGCRMFHNESLVYFDCNNTEFHVLITTLSFCRWEILHATV